MLSVNLASVTPKDRIKTLHTLSWIQVREWEKNEHQSKLKTGKCTLEKATDRRIIKEDKDK